VASIHRQSVQLGGMVHGACWPLKTTSTQPGMHRRLGWGRSLAPWLMAGSTGTFGVRCPQVGASLSPQHSVYMVRPASRATLTHEEARDGRLKAAEQELAMRRGGDASSARALRALLQQASSPSHQPAAPPHPRGRMMQRRAATYHGHTRSGPSRAVESGPGGCQGGALRRARPGPGGYLSPTRVYGETHVYPGPVPKVGPLSGAQYVDSLPSTHAVLADAAPYVPPRHRFKVRGRARVDKGPGGFQMAKPQHRSSTDLTMRIADNVLLTYC